MYRMGRQGLVEAIRVAEMSLGCLQNWVNRNCEWDEIRQMEALIDNFEIVAKFVIEKIG